MSSVGYIRRRDVARATLEVARSLLLKKGYKIYSYKPTYRDAVMCNGAAVSMLPFDWGNDHIITSNSTFVKEEEMLTLDIEYDGKIKQSKSYINIINADHIVKITYVNDITADEMIPACPVSIQIDVTTPGAEYENISLSFKEDQIVIGANTTKENEKEKANKLSKPEMVKEIIKERKLSIWHNDGKNKIEYVESNLNDFSCLYLVPDNTNKKFNKLFHSEQIDKGIDYEEYYIKKNEYKILENNIINSERSLKSFSYVLEMIKATGINFNINYDFVKSYGFYHELFNKFASGKQSGDVSLVQYANGRIGNKYPYSESSNELISRTKLKECEFTSEKGTAKKKK